jgi:hypothetical protein
MVFAGVIVTAVASVICPIAASAAHHIAAPLINGVAIGLIRAGACGGRDHGERRARTRLDGLLRPRQPNGAGRNPRVRFVAVLSRWLRRHDRAGGPYRNRRCVRSAPGVLSLVDVPQPPRYRLDVVQPSLRARRTLRHWRANEPARLVPGCEDIQIRRAKLVFLRQR